MAAVARRTRPSPYPNWFFLPAAIIYSVLFLLPTIASLWFSLTRWDLFEAHFIGLRNFRQFFSEPFLVQGLVNTVIYGFATSAAKTVLGLLLAVLLTGEIIARGLLRTVVFFPVLVSTRLTNPTLAIYSVIIIDVWKGVGLATVIFMAGLASIPQDYYEASRIDGATRQQQFWRITLPLVWPATVTVITLSLIGGLRSFDLIWAMTGGGPGFSSDVVASVIYKQYQAGFYGLATAGNVILFMLIAVIVVPLTLWFNRREVEA